MCKQEHSNYSVVEAIASKLQLVRMRSSFYSLIEPSGGSEIIRGKYFCATNWASSRIIIIEVIACGYCATVVLRCGLNAQTPSALRDVSVRANLFTFLECKGALKFNTIIVQRNAVQFIIL